MNKTEKIIGFDIIKDKLEEYSVTKNAKERVKKLEPLLSETEVRASQRETSQARIILDKFGNPPIPSLDGVDNLLSIAVKGGCLSADELEKIAVVLTAFRRMKDFLQNSMQLQLSISYYDENIDSLDNIREEIRRIIRGGRIDDYATKNLKVIRGEIGRIENKMHEKADAILKANKSYLSDSFCTSRNGRICLPVKKEYKFRISGSVIDKSSTGSTLFIEPTAISKYTEELALLKIEEENEERTILYTLTAMLADKKEIFDQNNTTIEKLDFIFAKGKLSAEYDGTEPEITLDRRISIVNGRHPLMDKNICVPLNFDIGEDINGIIITGPNTGGKTVSIKTVGLNCYMAECGLHVSCEKAVICLNNQILCDIGDGQNISENLSTFSAHITSVLDILKKADRESLVILDELGSGTDPTEGMGIAIAILKELKESGTLYLVTTHYPEVKNYAETTQGVVNARMTFDRVTLKPLYKLEIGKAGESCAFYIAKKLGMPGKMLNNAQIAAYGEKSKEFRFDENETLLHSRGAKIKKKKEISNRQTRADKFNIGDSVMIYPDKKIGIVCEKANEKGVIRIQMPNKKIYINHKRIKLHVAATELYPEDYDFSIIFDTVENRKIRHEMDRKFCEDQIVEGE